MNLLVLGLWGLTGLVGGVAIWVVTPWATARVGGWSWIERVSAWYVWAAQTFIGRSGVIIRDEELSIVQKRWDDDFGADVDTAADDKRHHHDDFGVLNRLSNRIFGFGLHDLGVWVSPLLAELGEKSWEMQQADEIGPDTRQRGDQTIPVFQDGIPVDERSQLVDLSAAKHLVEGSSSPTDGQDSYDRTKISQSPFTQTVSAAQGLLLMAGFVGALAAVLYLGGGDSGGGSTSSGNETVLGLFGILVLPRIRQAVATGLHRALDVVEILLQAGGGGSDDRLQRWGRQVAAVLLVVMSLIILPAIAVVTHGVVYAVVAFTLQLLMLIALPFGVWMLGPMLPGILAVPFGKIAWILAQLTTDGGVIVERKSGILEYHQLVEADDTVDWDYETWLSDGTHLPIDGDPGDLYRFAWNDLGVTVEKDDRNVGPLALGREETQAVTDGGEIRSEQPRGGFYPVFSVDTDADWIVTLPYLETWCEDTGRAAPVRRGRQRALTEEGGQQGLSQLMFTLLLLAAPMLGAGMGYLIQVIG